MVFGGLVSVWNWDRSDLKKKAKLGFEVTARAETSSRQKLMVLEKDQNLMALS